ncbi:NAD(P)H-hydrate dehydratase [Microbulbifer hydrolyticus]|uniref:Bifunctional NAD(P)H-hydrate repair enzyme n=1 Tax=Microbulbifer hydrolyticus TaxID=48074 RepID=A0A6P1T7W8_9GAMM|nr:NAD(P)H-hydrate dehydratase [Microbulbifer hydrolyticus]MBB5211430.1 NAD(P)H-hydrate epimerase [Microbulbifer hydrolyticus]QHQ37815.1 NAD(P)H-hydrate dehydratase [Microbulbifer hydrolyticus]
MDSQTLSPKSAPAIPSAPQSLYSAESVRQLDQLVISQQQIPGLALMKRAGRAAYDCLRQRWPDVNALQVFCGGGNNGGDGYVIAGLAAQRQLPAWVFVGVPVEKLKGEALEAYRFAEREGATLVSSLQELPPIEKNTVLVDALLGTGFSGALRAPMDSAIGYINQSAAPVLAVDLPSGLHADSGTADDGAVQADITVTFIGRKTGLYLGRGPALTGEVIFDDLGAAPRIYEQVPALLARHSGDSIERLPVRSADSYKNQFGHVMVVGGDHGYGGAALMASESAARAGAGLVSLASRPEHVAAALTRCPEVMARPVVSGQELEPLLAAPDVIAVGPGLGQSPWSEQLLARAGRAEAKLVLDADALNILAGGRVLAGVKRDDWVLTPHVGEAARLLGVSNAEVTADRVAAARAIQQKFSGVVVLKGTGTLIAHSGGVELINSGNPGMASGGMGDLLTGVIAALIGQGMALPAAARLAVWLHGEAGNRAAQNGQRGLLATDLLPHIRALVD